MDFIIIKRLLLQQDYVNLENNHQKQIIKEFVEKHYILELDDFDQLDKKLKEIKKFQPKEYESNTKYFIEDLEHYIDIELSHNKGDLFRKFMIYGFFGLGAVLLQLLAIFLFQFKYLLLSFFFCFVPLSTFRAKSILGESMF